MKKFIIPLLALVALAQPAEASTSRLYDDCKVFEKNGFKIEVYKNDKELYQNASCFHQMTAAIAFAGSVCTSVVPKKKISYALKEEDYQGVAFLQGWNYVVGKFGSSASFKDIDSVIREFLNYAEKTPEDWGYAPQYWKFLSKKWPCDE